jgi:orotidine-5'-phosphate decarboxylase
MMQAAARAAAEFTPRPNVLGVTVLTSLEAADLETLGLQASPLEQVTRLARLAKQAGLDGIFAARRRSPRFVQPVARISWLLHQGCGPAAPVRPTSVEF